MDKPHSRNVLSLISSHFSVPSAMAFATLSIQSGPRTTAAARLLITPLWQDRFPFCRREANQKQACGKHTFASCRLPTLLFWASLLILLPNIFPFVAALGSASFLSILVELIHISTVRYTYVSECGETKHHDFEPRGVQANIKIQPIHATSVHVTIPNSIHSYCQHLTIIRNCANEQNLCT